MNLVHLLSYLATLVVLVPMATAIRAPKLRQLVYLFASYAFYLTLGSWWCLLVLCSSTLANYFFAWYLRRNPSSPRLWAGVLFNVALLSVYKYLPILMPANSELTLVQYLVRLTLPIGISFWTFQALSYLVDIYREEPVDPTMLEFALYMAFAPTVLSGPICRLYEMLPQFREAPTFDWERVTKGVQRIWLGILMTSLAQILEFGFRPGHGLDTAFARGTSSALDNWMLGFGYGLQLFFDFAGYSHIVIGIAILLGIRLQENFSKPFLASSPSEFWTRWHMSLSFWIRDYVFLPLATMRREIAWRYFALLFSMVIFGVWHKGATVFLIWGAYQGVLLVLHRIWQQTNRTLDLRWPKFLSTIFTVCAISAGWLFFRAASAKDGWRMFSSLFVPSAYTYHGLDTGLYLTVMAFATACLAMWLLVTVDSERPQLSWLPIELRYVCYGAAFYLVVFRAAVPQAFIYTQF